MPQDQTRQSTCLSRNIDQELDCDSKEDQSSKSEGSDKTMTEHEHLAVALRNDMENLGEPFLLRLDLQRQNMVVDRSGKARMKHRKVWISICGQLIFALQRCYRA